MDEGMRRAGIAHGEAIVARPRRSGEADHVVVDLGGGMGWRVRRLDHVRIVGRRRPLPAARRRPPFPFAAS